MVIESDPIGLTGCGFLLMFYSNFVPKIYEIFDLTLKLG